VDITYLDNKLGRLCEDHKVAQRTLGVDGFKKLRARLADLRAASVVSELVAGHPHPLTADRAGQFALSLDKGRRLVFVPDHNEPVQDSRGNIDWTKVSKIKIILIGDYHE
jgi:proteic killer suppression protein